MAKNSACGVDNFHIKMRSTYVGVEYLTKNWRERKQYEEIHFQMKRKSFECSTILGFLMNDEYHCSDFSKAHFLSIAEKEFHHVSCVSFLVINFH